MAIPGCEAMFSFMLVIISSFYEWFFPRRQPKAFHKPALKKITTVDFFSSNPKSPLKTMRRLSLWTDVAPEQQPVPVVNPAMHKHYIRAKELGIALGVDVDIIKHLKTPYWEGHMHPSIVKDLSASTILSIHVNLCMGTIARYSDDRPDLQSLLQDLMEFKLFGQFMLTELGHGLDAKNLETRATMLPRGGFDLHTPSRQAAKTMPPTSLEAGVARVAVVFARLVDLNGQDRGIKPFLVPINEADRMCPGVKCKVLPVRPAATPLDHSITYFDHVFLEQSALLGSAEIAENPRKDFFELIQRVAVGGLSLSMTNVPSLRQACYTVAKYSLRRTVASPLHADKKTPIITFRTQHRPILLGFAQASVYEAYGRWSVKQFLDPETTAQKKHGVVIAFKASVIRDSQATFNELIDRCGWQGLFTHSTITELMFSNRGNSIAEGDVLVLCIKLASELLTGKYSMPAARYPDSLLARHEKGLFRELKVKATKIVLLNGGSHRSAEFNEHILPWCKTLVEAIGQRMAYEAAVDAGVPHALIQLYEANCVLHHDESWYIENTDLTRQMIKDNDAKAVQDVYPMLDKLMFSSGAEPYVTAPLVSEERWNAFEDSLTTYG